MHFLCQITLLINKETIHSNVVHLHLEFQKSYCPQLSSELSKNFLLSFILFKDVRAALKLISTIRK